MNRIFVTADTHFGHAKMLEFESAHYGRFQSIEERDEYLIERWNAVVAPGDTVWHLGDVMVGQKPNELLARLNGRKNLILGNHDRYPVALYAKYFNRIAGGVVLKNCLLSHLPIHPMSLFKRLGNIHGHLHSRTVGDPRYVCVSLEQTGLAPVLLSEILENLKGVQINE